jgi:L-arabinonolactonase
MLAAFETGLYAFDLKSASKTELLPFEPDVPTTRLNDGRCDRFGRFVVGGLNEDGLKPTSKVISYGEDGTSTTLIDGVGCSNSICFSPDGKVMYFTDTPSRTILKYDYDPATGAVENKRVFARLNDDEGNPDGSCIDSEGRLWNAQWDGGRVQCYEPDGLAGPTIYLPCPQVTCAAFGGEDLGTLYITSAREDLSAAEITKAPLSGALFAIDAKGLFGAVGLPESHFGQRADEPSL